MRVQREREREGGREQYSDENRFANGTGKGPLIMNF
jgi:hypothetical protein